MTEEICVIRDHLPRIFSDVQIGGGYLTSPAQL
jgi:hypothetical protein